MAYLRRSRSASSMVRLKDLIDERAFTNTGLAQDEDISFINIIDP
jgi:hypothetical protein